MYFFNARVWPARSAGLFGSQSGPLMLTPHNDFSMRAMRGKFCFYRLFARIAVRNVTHRGFIVAGVGSALSKRLMSMDRRLNRGSCHDPVLVE